MSAPEFQIHIHEVEHHKGFSIAYFNGVALV